MGRGRVEYLRRMLTRRALIRGGIAAGAALALAGLVYEFMPDRERVDTRYRYTMLDDEDRVILAAIAPVMLEGALPAEPHAQADAVMQVLRGADIAIGGLPLETRAQLRQLFGILRFPLTRMFAAGVWRPWHEAGPQDIAQFLSSWRYSRIVQLRAAYDALHQLVMASWYGNDVAWSAIGYAGPPEIG